MTVPDPMLPLPPAVLARLATAETLRAELAGMTVERDELRAELQTAAWERDTAQNEAAYLREDVLGRDRVWGEEVRQPVGRILTSGDDPPPPSESGRDDVALVSLSTGDVRVRASYSPDQWTRYGEDLSSSDFATLAERGPWITVENHAYRDHPQRAKKRRRLREALWAVGPGLAKYPDAAADLIAQFNGPGSRISLHDEDNAADRLGWLQSLLGVVRREWEVEQHRADRLTEALAATPHVPDWRPTADPTVRRCSLCRTFESDHLTAEADS